MAIAERVVREVNIQLSGQPHIWFISGFSPRVWGGGGEEAVNVVAREFANYGINVSSLHGVIYERPHRQETLPDNFSLREIPQSRFADFKGFSFQRYLIFRQLIQQDRPAFAVINMPGRIGLAAALALKDSKVPTTFWWHGTQISYDKGYDYQHPSSKAKNLLRKFILNPLKTIAVKKMVNCSNFTHATCSEFTFQQLQDGDILNPGAAKVLNPPTSVGLDNESLGDTVHVDGVRSDDLVVFIPARVAPDKQFYNVRELISLLQPALGGKRRINFVSAGPAPSPEYLGYAFPQVDTEVLKTTYLGVLDRCGMERVYGRTDCVLMPNRAEPFGLATVEAMRFGLPILGFNSGGTAEILREFPHYPQYLIAEKRGQISIDPIKAFLVATPDQRWVGLNHKREILERFDPKRLAKQVLDFIITDRSLSS